MVVITPKHVGAVLSKF